MINNLQDWYLQDILKIYNDKVNDGPSSFNKIRLLGQMTPLCIYRTTLKRHDPTTRFVFQSFQNFHCVVFLLKMHRHEGCS